MSFTMTVRSKTRLYYSLVVVYGLMLLPWPIVSLFVTAFGFDNPNTVPLAWCIVLPIWFYPALWVGGLLWGRQSVKRNESTLRVILKTSIPLLSPMWWMVVAPLGGSAWEALTHEQANREFFTFVVRVHDLADKPIPQAKVELTGKGGSTMSLTDDSGATSVMEKLKVCRDKPAFGKSGFIELRGERLMVKATGFKEFHRELAEIVVGGHWDLPAPTPPEVLVHLEREKQVPPH